MHVAARSYFLTWAALMGLAAVSLLLSFLHFETGDLVISLAIAFTKATLVAWFFMHLAEQRFANRLVLIMTALLFALLIALMALDVATRHTFPKASQPTESNTFYKR